MDTLCHGNAVYEFGSIYNAYVGFSDLNHSNVENFLGISYDTAAHIWKKTLEMYFETTDENVLAEAEKKAQLAGYLRLFRRSYTRGASEEQIEFYKNKVITLVSELDSLAY